MKYQIGSSRQVISQHLDVLEKTDVPLGEHRWLTVVSPEQSDGPELVLEPGAHPVVRPFKQALVEDGPVTTATFDDTCGNLIPIASQ